MSKMSTMFRSVSYGPCSRTGVTCVVSDFGGIIWHKRKVKEAIYVKQSLREPLP